MNGFFSGFRTRSIDKGVRMNSKGFIGFNQEADPLAGTFCSNGGFQRTNYPLSEQHVQALEEPLTGSIKTRHGTKRSYRKSLPWVKSAKSS
jgi:hypothetical protein